MHGSKSTLNGTVSCRHLSRSPQPQTAMDQMRPDFGPRALRHRRRFAPATRSLPACFRRLSTNDEVCLTRQLDFRNVHNKTMLESLMNSRSTSCSRGDLKSQESSYSQDVSTVNSAHQASGGTAFSLLSWIGIRALEFWIDVLRCEIA